MQVNLNTKFWITASTFAKKHNVARQQVNRWIKEKRIDSVYIKEWRLRLIRIDSTIS